MQDSILWVTTERCCCYQKKKKRLNKKELGKAARADKPEKEHRDAPSFSKQGEHKENNSKG